MPIYVTTPTNIWVWQRAITITLELYGCCKANVECRTQLILAVSCLWLTYSTFIQCLLHDHGLDLYYTRLWPNISQVKVQYTTTPI